MASKLFVGSLAYSVTDQELQDFFAPFGEVVSAKVIIDRDTNRSKGFGFVEMSSEDDAKKAIDELSGKDLNGRPVNVSLARPKEESGRGQFNNSQGGQSSGGRRY